jgi:hypothetical protein
MAEFADIWYIQAPFGRDEHYNSSRYHGLEPPRHLHQRDRRVPAFQRHPPRRGNQGIHPVLPGGGPSGPDPEESLGQKDGDGQRKIRLPVLDAPAGAYRGRIQDLPAPHAETPHGNSAWRNAA